MTNQNISQSTVQVFFLGFLLSDDKTALNEMARQLQLETTSLRNFVRSNWYSYVLRSHIKVFIYFRVLFKKASYISLDLLFQVDLQLISGHVWWDFNLKNSCAGPEKIPLVFVLDEFDAFLQHKNQTLLYNLLDTMNNFEASICIIGLTSRMVVYFDEHFDRPADSDAF